MDIEARLQGTRRGNILHEFLTNSVHFPLANVILELLVEGPKHYLWNPDLYVIVVGSIVQAIFLGGWRYKECYHLFFGNLIGPALYTAAEVALEGARFFDSPQHYAYWGFALVIGSLQSLQLLVPGRGAKFLHFLEGVVRTCILLVMYGLIEHLSGPQYTTIGDFLQDRSHLFVTIVIPLLGVVVGFAAVTSQHYLTQLRTTAGQLRHYSEWLLGPQILRQAVEDPRSIEPRRQKRCVLFMDIRGSTEWGEAQSPEAVSAMLNGYFETADRVLKNTEVVKAQFIGDEVMWVVADADAAIAAARTMMAEIQVALAPYRLAVGIGINLGPVMEGLIGGGEVKSFTVVGDTVNSAKRICDAASPGEVLISEAVREHGTGGIAVGGVREVTAKGKRLPLRVFPLPPGEE